MKYLKFYAKRFPVLAWERQATFPAQKVDPRANDTAVAKSLLKIAAEAKATSGSAEPGPVHAAFKEDHQNSIRELAPADHPGGVQQEAGRVCGEGGQEVRVIFIGCRGAGDGRSAPRTMMLARAGGASSPARPAVSWSVA